jgi:hypothetical protein
LQAPSRRCPSNAARGPIVIVDYGSSQGKNSLGPLRTTIEAVRQKVGGERPILVYHEDLPMNDFNALFDVLHDDPDSYALNQPSVFPCAIRRSFYEEVCPRLPSTLVGVLMPRCGSAACPCRFPAIST